MTAEEIHHMFSYHPVKGDQAQRYIKIREAARQLAQVIIDNTPVSADQTAAIRKVREAMATANDAIALKEPDKPFEPSKKAWSPRQRW